MILSTHCTKHNHNISQKAPGYVICTCCKLFVILIDMKFESEFLERHVSAVGTRVNIGTAKETMFIPQMLGCCFKQARRIVVGVPQLISTFGTLFKNNKEANLTLQI